MLCYDVCGQKNTEVFNLDVLMRAVQTPLGVVNRKYIVLKNTLVLEVENILYPNNASIYKCTRINQKSIDKYKIEHSTSLTVEEAAIFLKRAIDELSDSCFCSSTSREELQRIHENFYLPQEVKLPLMGKITFNKEKEGAIDTNSEEEFILS